MGTADSLHPWRGGYGSTALIGAMCQGDFLANSSWLFFYTQYLFKARKEASQMTGLLCFVLTLQGLVCHK